MRVPGLAKARRWGGMLVSRTALVLDRLLAWIPRRPVIVVAAIHDFPVPSQTFVYQEVLAMQQHVMDVRFHCWRWVPSAAEVLPQAFRPLLSRARVLRHEASLVRADLAFWKRREPRLVDALFSRLARELDSTRDRLEDDHQILMAFTFARVALRARATYLHSYFFYEQSFFALVAATLLRIPRGMTAYVDHMLGDSRLKLVAWHMETCDLVVATSQRVARELRERAGLGPDGRPDILVKPNGVDGARFTPRSVPAQPDGTESSPLVLLSVSRIEPKKGLVELCASLVELRDRGVWVQVHLAGDADPATPGSVEYADNLRRTIEQHGLDRGPVAVTMHGFVRQDDMEALCAPCHAFVAPYVETDRGDKDGVPTAVVEAMARAMPVVCTDAGSLTEVVRHETEGLLVRQRDGMAFADALERLVREPALVSELGAAARRRFESAFDSRVVERTLHTRIAALLRR